MSFPSRRAALAARANTSCRAGSRSSQIAVIGFDPMPTSVPWRSICTFGDTKSCDVSNEISWFQYSRRNSIVCLSAKSAISKGKVDLGGIRPPPKSTGIRTFWQSGCVVAISRRTQSASISIRRCPHSLIPARNHPGPITTITVCDSSNANRIRSGHLAPGSIDVESMKTACLPPALRSDSAMSWASAAASSRR